MEIDKNEEYFHLENKNLKILFENETGLLNKGQFKND